jgi:hypothetical protein
MGKIMVQGTFSSEREAERFCNQMNMPSRFRVGTVVSIELCPQSRSAHHNHLVEERCAGVKKIPPATINVLGCALSLLTAGVNNHCRLIVVIDGRVQVLLRPVVRDILTEPPRDPGVHEARLLLACILLLRRKQTELPEWLKGHERLAESLLSLPPRWQDPAVVLRSRERRNK